jgi:hypothetical protein
LTARKQYRCMVLLMYICMCLSHMLCSEFC